MKARTIWFLRNIKNQMGQIIIFLTFVITIWTYQIILVIVLNAIIAYDKEKHEYDFDILLVGLCYTGY